MADVTKDLIRLIAKQVENNSLFVWCPCWVIRSSTPI